MEMAFSPALAPPMCHAMYNSSASVMHTKQLQQERRTTNG